MGLVPFLQFPECTPEDQIIREVTSQETERIMKVVKPEKSPQRQGLTVYDDLISVRRLEIYLTYT